MSWSDLHKQSEVHTDAADLLRVRGQHDAARREFRSAAALEEQALAHTEDEPRTYGHTAVSAANLWFQGGDPAQARRVAEEALAKPSLAEFARDELHFLLKQMSGQAKTPPRWRGALMRLWSAVFGKGGQSTPPV